jgi:hypothetical protein
MAARLELECLEVDDFMEENIKITAVNDFNIVMHQ